VVLDFDPRICPVLTHIRVSHQLRFPIVPTPRPADGPHRHSDLRLAMSSFPRRTESGHARPLDATSPSTPMESCVLRPPNNQQFSDAVIGGVVQRSRSSRDRFIAGDRSHSLGVGTWAGRSSPQSWPSPQPRERAPSLSTPSSERRWESHQDATKPIVTAKASAEDSIKSEHVQGVNDLVGSEKQRLRELRRQRQIRYRKKKEGYTNSLEEETARLRDEIGKLKQRRRAVSRWPPPSRSGAWPPSTSGSSATASADRR
jgi:hypothetical protein